MTKETSTTDLWSLWFNRIVQIVGLALVVYEALFAKTDRPFLFILLGAMMLGSLGIRIFVRALGSGP